jgi:hypothetical protein
MAEPLLSQEALRILATPFPGRLVMLRAASEQVKADIAIECQRRLNEEFPDYREVTDLLAKAAIDG